MNLNASFPNPDPVCAAPTRESLFRGCWSTLPPLKDGTTIVAVGRVIITEDICTSVDSFVAAIYWEKDSSGYEGWHFRDTGMVVACSLDDEVKIDYWNPYPAADAKARKEAA